MYSISRSSCGSLSPNTSNFAISACEALGLALLEITLFSIVLSGLTSLGTRAGAWNTLVFGLFVLSPRGARARWS